MAQDTPGWQYFRQWMSEKHQEKMQDRAWAHELMRYEQEKKDQAEERRQQNAWQEHRDIAQMFNTSYSQANTPMEKEQIRNNWLAYSKTMPKNMRFGVEQFLKDSPLSQQKMADAEWFKNNPSPPEPGFKPEENMHKYASMVYAKEVHKALFAKERRRQTYQIPEEIPLDTDTYAYRDAQGNVQLGKYEEKNKFYDQLAEGSGMSGYALAQRSGWGKPERTTVYRTDPNTGSQYQDIIEIEHNLVTGKRRVQTVYSGEIKKSTSSSSARGDHQGAIIQPDQEAEHMIAFLQSGGSTEGMTPIQEQKYERITEFSEELFKQAKKAKTPEEQQRLMQSYADRIDDELKGLDSRFVYSIVAKDGAALKVDDPWGFTGPHFKLGDNAFIKAIYGRRTTLRTKDGVLIKVVIDDEHNRVSDMNGDSIGTIAEATAYIGSKTVAELGGE